MNFVDKALARRLESAEEIPQVRYAKIFQKLQPQIGRQWNRFVAGT